MKKSNQIPINHVHVDPDEFNFKQLESVESPASQKEHAKKQRLFQNFQISTPKQQASTAMPLMLRGSSPQKLMTFDTNKSQSNQNDLIYVDIQYDSENLGSIVEDCNYTTKNFQSRPTIKEIKALDLKVKEQSLKTPKFMDQKPTFEIPKVHSPASKLGKQLLDPYYEDRSFQVKNSITSLVQELNEFNIVKEEDNFDQIQNLSEIQHNKANSFSQQDQLECRSDILKLSEGERGSGAAQG